RPRPAVWWSATAMNPSGAPFAAAARTMSCVDGQSGSSEASWPNRAVVRGLPGRATSPTIAARMLRTRHVSVDLSARARERDRLDRHALADRALGAAPAGGGP